MLGFIASIAVDAIKHSVKHYLSLNDQEKEIVKQDLREFRDKAVDKVEFICSDEGLEKLKNDFNELEKKTSDKLKAFLSKNDRLKALLSEDDNPEVEPEVNPGEKNG